MLLGWREYFILFALLVSCNSNNSSTQFDSYKLKKPTIQEVLDVFVLKATGKKDLKGLDCDTNQFIESCISEVSCPIILNKKTAAHEFKYADFGGFEIAVLKSGDTVRVQRWGCESINYDFYFKSNGKTVRDVYADGIAYLKKIASCIDSNKFKINIAISSVDKLLLLSKISKCKVEEIDKLPEISYDLDSNTNVTLSHVDFKSKNPTEFYLCFGIKLLDL